MNIEFNTNVKLLTGGTFCGNNNWNKLSSSIDNCFKLYYITSGRTIVIEEDKTHILEADKLYFINGYKLDSQKYIEPFIVDWVHFAPNSLYFNYILKEAPFVTELTLEDFTSFKGYFTKFKSFFKNELDETEKRYVLLEIQALIQFAITKVFRSVDSKIAKSDNQFQRILPSLDFLAKNYKQNLSLKQLAEECCLSPNYFHRIFTKVFKVSPLNYIRDIRMNEATRQLAYTNLTVKEIAYNVGYDDEAYFSRVFSKTHGTSPGSYRKNCKNNIP